MTGISKIAVGRMMWLTAIAASAAFAIVLVVLWIRLPTQGPGTISSAATTAPRAGSSLSKEVRFALPPHPTSLPELRFVGGDGRPMTFADFRGHIVLLNLWATWCVPCRKEMPTLDRLQAALGGPQFQVVPLSIDRGGLPGVKAFYRQLGLKSLGIYNDPTGRAASDLGAVGIPTTLLVDGEGREIGRKVGPADWDSPQAVAVIRRYIELASHGARPASTRRTAP